MLSLTEEYCIHTITVGWDEKTTIKDTNKEIYSNWRRSVKCEWVSEWATQIMITMWMWMGRVSVTICTQTQTHTYCTYTVCCVCNAESEWMRGKYTIALTHMQFKRNNNKSKFRSTSRAPNSFRQFHRNEKLVYFYYWIPWRRSAPFTHTDKIYFTVITAIIYIQYTPALYYTDSIPKSLTVHILSSDCTYLHHENIYHCSRSETHTHTHTTTASVTRKFRIQFQYHWMDECNNMMATKHTGRTTKEHKRKTNIPISSTESKNSWLFRIFEKRKTFFFYSGSFAQFHKFLNSIFWKVGSVAFRFAACLLNDCRILIFVGKETFQNCTISHGFAGAANM